MFHHFVVTTKTTQPHPEVFLVNGFKNLSILLHDWRHFLHITQTSSILGQQ